MTEIYKVAAIVLKDKKMLIVREKGRKIYLSLGGQPEPGETKEQTIIREIQEEIGTKTKSLEFFGRFTEDAVLHKGRTLVLTVYMAEIDGEPTPCSEIEEIKWVDKDLNKENILVGSIIEKHLIPELVEKGLM